MTGSRIDSAYRGNPLHHSSSNYRCRKLLLVEEISLALGSPLGKRLDSLIAQVWLNKQSQQVRTTRNQGFRTLGGQVLFG